jgi:hypothetical protein
VLKSPSLPRLETPDTFGVHAMLTDEEIFFRFGDEEDSFVERKSRNDVNDSLKTAVAFANTSPIG